MKTIAGAKNQGNGKSEKQRIRERRKLLPCGSNTLLLYCSHAFRFTYLLLFTSYFLVVFGCGYAMQTKANLPFDSIAIGKIENKTSEPKLQDKLRRALVETFSEYGFQVALSARHLLECEIIGFELTPVAERGMTAVQYVLSIKAKFVVRDLNTGHSVIFPTETPFVTYFSSANKVETILAQKELSTNNALRNLSQELIRRITYEY